MGNVSSRADDGSPVLLRDHNRLSVTGVKITTTRNKTLYTITPNSFPPTRFIVKREPDDEGIVEYIQDPDSASPNATPNFLLRLNNDEEFFFYFTFVMRQEKGSTTRQGPDGSLTSPSITIDTVINSLTFMFGSTARDLETLMTREFNADPNIHRNPNVELVGDYTTAGSFVEQFEWAWKWRPPKVEKDKGGGWRNSCSFVEYDSRSHRLYPLVSFSFWVQNTKAVSSPKSPSPRMELALTTPRLRIASAQSIESRLSDSDTEANYFREPPSPIEAIPEYGANLEPTETLNTVKVDLNFQRPGEDVSAVEDGPLFRATMKALEQKTSTMRMRIKKVIKKAEAAKEAQDACNTAVLQFMGALREASTSNANAVQPALDHYFEKIATEILAYERQNAINLQKLIIDPIGRLYANDIKQAEAKKKDFDEESRDYYAHVARYLGQRQDSLKEKKRAEVDLKYESKRRNFELKRFDYSSFMQDLHGGRKDQLVLSQLTKYAETQARTYLDTAKRIESMAPQLDALCFEVGEADKEYQLLRTGREEKRRALEKGVKPNNDFESSTIAFNPLTPTISNHDRRLAAAEAEFGQLNGLTPPVIRERPRSVGPVPANGASPSMSGDLGLSPSQRPQLSASPSQNKFKGIRDLEERDRSLDQSGPASTRKEGLLWSMSRPGSLSDPKGLKPGWHKFWVTLDQGKLSEHVNWKQGLEPHNEPIDLRVASVREARSAERRFCFEVITPHFIRVYQAQSDEEMKAWISAINNALQTAFEGKAPPPEIQSGGKSARDLFGKSSSLHNHRSLSTSQSLAAKNVARHATVGDRPNIARSRSSEERTGRLLQTIREADAGNAWCADCGSDSRVEWVSINLGIILCIECSGIHRSLGTHISKVRSLTLDTVSFTQDITELLLQIGNRVSNMVWEAKLNGNPHTNPNDATPNPSTASSTSKPSPTSTRDHRLRFITAKYADRAFVISPSSPTSPGSQPHPPEEILLASIKRNDIRNVLYALALHANPNATDRSRATHAVYLALAAADPAAPASMQHQHQPSQNNSHPSPPVTATGTPTHPHQNYHRNSFPVAELLLQNGAELPSTPAPFPLSVSARLYLDFKRDQKLGVVRGSGGMGGNANSHALATSAPSAAGGPALTSQDSAYVTALPPMPQQYQPQPQPQPQGGSSPAIGGGGFSGGYSGGFSGGFSGGNMGGGGGASQLDKGLKRVSAGRQLLKGLNG